MEAGNSYFVDAAGNVSATQEPGVDYVGTITFTGSGKTLAYEFTLNNDSDVVNGIAQGDSKDITLNFTVKDGSTADNNSASESLKFTIQGTNDKPTVEAVSRELFEDDAQVTGNVNAHDIDGDTISYFVTVGYDAQALDKLDDGLGLPDAIMDQDAHGLYGTLTIDASGKYTYTPNALAQTLDDNESFTDKFTVFVQDDKGAWVAKPLTFTVKGTNDAPIITHVSDSLVVTESGHGLEFKDQMYENVSVPGVQAAAGIVQGIDVDVEELTYSIDGSQSKEGSLTLSDLVGDFNILGSLSDKNVFTYDSVTDLGYGSVYFNSATGAYVFVLDNDSSMTQALTKDASETITFTVRVSDGTVADDATEKVTVTIHGTNDKPTLSLDADKDGFADDGHLVITENNGDVANVVSGKFSGFDVDAGEEDGLKYELGITRLELGNPTVQEIFDSMLDALNIPSGPGLDMVEQAISKVYEAVVDADQTKDSLLQDIPGIKYGDVSEDGHTVYGLYGKMELNVADGLYTYTLYTWDEARESVETMAAFLALQHRDGEEALPTENFTLYVKDENDAWGYQNITVTVKSYDDAPEITFAGQDLHVIEAGVGTTAGVALTTGAVDALFETVLGLTGGIGASALEEFRDDLVANLSNVLVNNYPLPNADDTGKTKASGVITAIDDDAEGFLRFGLSHDGENAKWGFSLPDLEELLTSGIFDFSFEDLALITDLTESLSALGKLPEMISGGFKLEDLQELIETLPSAEALKGLFDGGASLDALYDLLQNSITLTVQGEYGNFILSQDGSYIYELDTNLSNSLAENESATESFTVKAYDIYGNMSEKEVEITITGTNDAPIIEQANNLILDEDGTAKGKVVASDEDNGDSVVYRVGPSSALLLEGLEDDIAAGLLDSTIDALMESWNPGIVIESLLGGLKDNEALQNAFKDLAKELDGKGALPTIGKDGTDADALDNYGLETEGKYGTLSIDPETGEYTYIPNENMESLAEGDSRVEEFTVYAQDESGAWTSKVITVTVNGKNNTPEYEEEVSFKVVEGSYSSVTTGAVNAFDADEGQNDFTYDAYEVKGNYGTFKVEANGSYTYTLDKDVDLANGETLSEKPFFVTGQNSNGETVSQKVTVSISDDVPSIVVDAPTYGNVYSGTIDFSIDGVNTVSINDTAITVGTPTVIAGLGTFTLLANGTYSLVALDNAETTVNLKVTDADGSMAEKSIIVEASSSLGDASAMSTAPIKTGSIFGQAIYKSNSQSLEGTSANDTVDKSGMSATSTVGAYTASNTISTDAGNDRVTLESSSAAMYAKESKLMSEATNTIDTGAGNDFVHLKGDFAMKAEGNSAVNTVKLGEGDDFLHIDGKIEGDSQNNNSIDGGAGSNTLKLENVNDNNVYEFTGNSDSFTVEGVDASFTNFDEFVFGDEDDVIIFDGFAGAINIDAGYGADLVRIDDLNLRLEDVLIEGGDDDSVDVLLAGVNDLAALKRGLAEGDINNMEVIIASGKPVSEGATADTVLQEIGAKSGNDWSLEAANGWTESDNNGNVPAGYREFVNKDDDITILVESSLLSN